MRVESLAVVITQCAVLRRRGGRTAKDLVGDLRRDFRLVLGEPLVHQRHQSGGLVAGLSPGARQEVLGHRVHSQPPHLAGKLHLRIRVEPQTEQPLGRLPRPLGVAQPHGHIQRHRFLLLQRGVVQRRDRVCQRQRLVELVERHVHLGDLHPQLHVGRQRGGDLAHQLDGLAALVVPPLQIRQLQPPIVRFVSLRLLHPPLEVRDEVAQQIVALVGFKGIAQQEDAAVVVIDAGRRKIDLHVGARRGTVGNWVVTGVSRGGIAC